VGEPEDGGPAGASVPKGCVVWDDSLAPEDRQLANPECEGGWVCWRSVKGAPVGLLYLCRSPFCALSPLCFCSLPHLHLLFPYPLTNFSQTAPRPLPSFSHP